MSLLLIYGPPAVGKLTTAQELAKITGYKIFHNHHTQDMVYPLFHYASPITDKLLADIRLTVFEAAMQNNVNLIFTFCFENPQHVSFLKKLIKKSKKYGVGISFVRLYCDFEKECERVVAPSRKKYPTKLHTVAMLKRALKEKNIDSRIEFVGDHLEIDTTSLPAKAVAEKIRSYYNIPRKLTDIRFRYSQKF
jgi:adenylate kinase family enzyme